MAHAAGVKRPFGTVYDLTSGKNDAEEPSSKKVKVEAEDPVPMSQENAATLLMTLQNGKTPAAFLSENSSSSSVPMDTRSVNPIPSGGSSSNNAGDKVTQDLARRIALVAERKFAEAIQLFRTEISSRANPAAAKPRLFYYLGCALIKRNQAGDRTAGIENFRAALAMGNVEAELEAELHYELADALQTRGDQGDSASATESLEAAERIQHNNANLRAKIWNDLGFAYASRNGEGDLAKAIEYYKKALDLEQNDQLLRAQLHLNLADAYICRNQDEDVDRAITSYKAALKLDHEDFALKAKIYSELGIVLLNKGDFSGAITSYKKGIELEDLHSNHSLKATLYNNLGDLYKRRDNNNDFSNAFRAYEAAAKIQHDLLGTKAHSHCELARLYESRAQAGDIVAALNHYKIAAALDHEDATLKAYVWYNLGALVLKHGQQADLSFAIENLKKAAALQSNLGPVVKAELYKFLGDGLTQRNQGDDAAGALQSYQAGAQIEHADKPLKAELFYKLGCEYKNRNGQGDLSRGIENFLLASSLEIQDVSFRLKLNIETARLCVLRQEAGDLSIGIRCMQEVVRLGANEDAPQKMNWHTKLGQMLLKRSEQNDLSLAIIHLSAAFETGEGTPLQKATVLNDLGIALALRNHEGDLNAAVESQKKAVGLLPQNHESIPRLLLSYAKTLVQRAVGDDLSSAITCYLLGIGLLANKQDVGLKEELLKGLVTVIRKKGDNVFPALRI